MSSSRGKSLVSHRDNSLTMTNMQGTCSRCSAKTEDRGDFHCRKNLIDKVKSLLSVDNIEYARDFVLSTKGDTNWEEWKNDMFRKFSREPIAARARLQWEKEIEEIKQKEVSMSQQKNIINSKDGMLSAQILDLLEKVDREEIIEESGLRLLEQESKFALAVYHYQRYKNSGGMDVGNSWHLATACKFLRRCGMPDVVIVITNEFSERGLIDFGADAAVFTSRGGAFKDISNLREAKKCIDEALTFSPNSYHVYNLLGAIYHREGNPDAGDEAFSQAMRLGANPKTKNIEMISVSNDPEVEMTSAVINYLLQKDYRKYAWIRKFRKKSGLELSSVS